MPLQVVRNDITRMHVDAIVNAANEHLLHGGGVCGAIFAAAGPAEMQAACDKIGHCDTGDAVATPAFRLPARHVIHTVGPIWHGGLNGEEEALRSCYRTSLELASKLTDKSIAFPLISSGIYGYPKEQAIDVALQEIHAFLDDNEMDVYLTIFDAASLAATGGRFAPIAEYIDDQYVQKDPHLRRRQYESFSRMGDPALLDADSATDTFAKDTAAPRMPSAPMQAAPASAAAAGRAKRQAGRNDFLSRLLSNLDAPFSATLFAMIDKRGLKDSDVYKRANMSRQHFSKIRKNARYQPKKQTVLALAVALELTLDETRQLLERAGYALTHADKRDVIVEYFIRQKTYDIYEINLALYAFDQPLLG